MSIPLEFGRYIFLTFSKDWLKLDEFARYDTSVVNRKLRTKFLSIMDPEQSILYCGVANYPPRFYFLWLSMRGIMIDKLSANNDTCSNECLSVEFDTCCHIRSLHLCQCKENSNGLQRIMDRIDSLTELSLYNITLPENIIQQLVDKCQQMKSIQLNKVHNTTYAALSSILDNCEALTSIVFNSCPDISETFIIHLLKKCKNLRCFKIVHRPHMRSFDLDLLESLLDHAGSLTSLGLSGMTLFSILSEGNNVHNLIRQCIQLKELTLKPPMRSFCDFSAIAKYLLQLTAFDVSGTAVEDTDMQKICSTCKLITKLNLSNCTRITNLTAIAIADNLLSLHEVRCSLCIRFTETAIVILCKPFLYVEVLNLHDTTLKGQPAVTHDENTMRVAQNTEIINNYKQLKQNKLVALLPKLRHMNSFTASGDLNGYLLQTFIITCGAKLTELDLYPCRSILINDNLLLIAEHCRQLKTLNILGAVKLHDISGIMAITHNNPNLRTLHTDLWHKMFLTSLQKIDKSCPKLRPRAITKLREVGVVKSNIGIGINAMKSPRK